MTKPTLYIDNRNYSSWSLRPRLVFQHFGLPFEEQVIPLFDENWDSAIAAVSPSRKVPCLVEGYLTIWETLAIIEYAADRHPVAAIWLHDARARAVARSVACEMHAGFGDLRSTMPMNIRKSLPGRGHTGALKDIERIMERWARRRTAGTLDRRRGRAGSRFVSSDSTPLTQLRLGLDKPKPLNPLLH